MAKLHGMVYLSGPMTGKREFNKPAFDRAKADLMARYPDLSIISPPDLDESHPIDPYSWEASLKRDLHFVVDADAIVALEGWRQSRGACLEVEVAERLGIPVFRYPSLRRVRL